MADEDRSGPVVDRTVAVVSPILADLGLELYDCEFGGGILRVTVDKPSGAVDLDEIALVTRLVSRDLDHDDFVPGRYTLEVTSPGLERHLREPKHYAWAVGRDVVVRLRNVAATDRRLAGRVTASDESGIDVVPTEGPARGTTIRVRYDEIDRARTVFVWAAAPKPTGAKPKPAAALNSDSDTTSHTQEVAAP
jgi:ribosome maturation factor RimP